jgi:hypothetical protein
MLAEDIFYMRPTTADHNIVGHIWTVMRESVANANREEDEIYEINIL